MAATKKTTKSAKTPPTPKKLSAAERKAKQVKASEKLDRLLGKVGKS